MQEKTNIQISTLRVPKNILEEIKIYCRKAGKPVGEWAETAWKFIKKNDFDIYDKETTPFLPVPPDIEKERNQVEALCMLMSEFITAQKQIQLPAPELIAKAAEEKVRAEMKSEEQAKELQVLQEENDRLRNEIKGKAMFVGFIRTVIIFNYDISATSIAPSTAGECCQPQPQ